MASLKTGPIDSLNNPSAKTFLKLTVRRDCQDMATVSLTVKHSMSWLHAVHIFS